MTSLQILLTVLVALCLVESIVWVPAQSIGFRAAFTTDPVFKQIATFRVADLGGIAFVFPALTRSAIFVSTQIPFSVSPDGIAIRWPEDHPAFGQFIPFEDLSTIEAVQRNLVLNERTRFPLASRYEAKVFARFVCELQRSPHTNRGDIINRFIASRMDPRLADSALKDFKKKTDILAGLCGSISIILFLMAPLLVWRRGFAATWFQILFCIFLNALLIAYFFHRSGKALAADGGGDLVEFATILLSPMSALNATQPLALSVSANFDPIAIAASRGATKDFRLLCSAAIRKMEFEPLVDGTANEQFAASDQWFRDQYLNELKKVAAQLGSDLADLDPPPSRDSAMAVSYCPRCHAQYSREDGACSDCSGIALKRFDVEPH
jgi:hypothetical protein